VRAAQGDDGQEAHTALAEASRLLRRGPRSPSGWKKSSVSLPRQAPSSCHSHFSDCGPGRREMSVMASPVWVPVQGRAANLQPIHRLFKTLIDAIHLTRLERLPA
jgi:hypothetical protein